MDGICNKEKGGTICTTPMSDIKTAGGRGQYDKGWGQIAIPLAYGFCGEF